MSPANSPAAAVAALREQLERFDAATYPVQHATASFHLGVTLIGLGAVPEAIARLERARELFPVEGLPVEHAKATNMLGVALRERGALTDAAAAFDTAAELFAANDSRLEQAAARYNAGLVLRPDSLGEATDSFAAAREVFAAAGAWAQAAAAGRELGSCLLDGERVEEAIEALTAAVTDAERGGDLAGLGAAANVLGLAHLAAGDAEAARASFEDAAGANPRDVRPDGYAMARANLALAWDRLGRPERARLAARQARDTPQSPPAATRQARDVIARLGDESGDLVAVLVDTPTDDRAPVIREELRRLRDLPVSGRDRELGSLLTAIGERMPEAADVAAAYLEVLLELPPAALDAMVAATVEVAAGLDEETAEHLRALVARGMARFNLPQFQRLQSLFSAAETVRGASASWG